MRKAIVTLLLLTFLLVIVGCSGVQGSTNAPPAPAIEKSEKPASTEIIEEMQSEYRIASLSVAVAEILDALELDLIGIPKSYKQLPERYRDVPIVGTAKTPDLELLMTLKPTDIISVSTLEYDLKPMFDEVGLDITFLKLDSLEGMKQDIIQLGKKFAREEQANALVQRFDQKVAEIQERIAGKEAPTVLILLGVPGSYLVATEHSYIGDLVKTIGGKNVIEDAQVEYLASNTEYLYQSNPDIILRLAHGMPEEVVRMFDEEFQRNDIWKHFNAVKNGRVYDLEEELFPTTATIRVEEALDELVRLLYP